MRRRDFLSLVGAGTAGVCSPAWRAAFGAPTAPRTRKPNIVFFLMDGQDGNGHRSTGSRRAG
ncbi:MAG TPA: hypothetical protein VGK32_12915 [Vicinamibacterales bacterium]